MNKFVKVFTKDLRRIANSWEGGMREECLFLFNNYIIDFMNFKNDTINLNKALRQQLGKELKLTERQINDRIKLLEKNGLLRRCGAKNEKLCIVTVATMTKEERTPYKKPRPSLTDNRSYYKPNLS